MLPQFVWPLTGIAFLASAALATNDIHKNIVAAESGNPIAMMELGRIYKAGEIIPQDLDESEKWIQQALARFETLAEAGDLDAKLGLGLFYLSGELIEVDYGKASALIYDAAKKGHVDSQYHHAALFADERFNERVSDRFYFWMRKAAKGGRVEAQKLIAFCCLEGWFRSRNPKESLSWWLKAAEQEDAESHFNAGLMYFNGEGTKIDYKKAIDHWTKSAQQGNAIAHYNLGAMYENGLGVKKDNALATKHYTRSREIGFEPKKNEDESEYSEVKNMSISNGAFQKGENKQSRNSGKQDVVHMVMYLPNELRKRLIQHSSLAYNGPSSLEEHYLQTEAFNSDEATSSLVRPRQLILESERASVRREQAEALKTWRENQ